MRGAGTFPRAFLAPAPPTGAGADQPHFASESPAPPWRGLRAEIIRSPVITEKSTLGSEFNHVTFKVPLDATKPEIRAAVEGLFEVKVKAVNTLRQKGKNKVFRGPARSPQRL